MNKEEFLKKLEKLLIKLPATEREEILSDYREHFQAGSEAGKTDDQISKELGDPGAIGRAYLADHMLSRVQDDKKFHGKVGSLMQAVFAAIGLSLFNLFFVLIPFFIVLSTLFTAWIIAFVPFYAGIKLLTIPTDHLISSGFTTISKYFASIGCVSGGCFFLIIMWLLSTVFILLVIKYVKANINIVLQTRSKA